MMIRLTLYLCSLTFLFALQPLAQPRDSLVIFAASSLTDVFHTLSTAFADTHDVDISLNFAGSSTLATQIENGAPADVFASANPQQMARLVADGLVQEDAVQIFAENELVIAVPADNPANIRNVRDLANDGVLLVLAAPEVPVRVYTDQLLETLSDLYEMNFSEALLANLASEEANVRQVVARIALGEADAGIVYRTDITAELSEMVTVIELPAGTSPRAQYVIAPIFESDVPEAAALFLEFLQTEAAQAILQDAGFCLPQTDPLPEATADPIPERTPETVADETDAPPCAATNTLD